MNLRELLWNLLLWGALPAWLLAGAADWLCHRRTRIELNSGPRESLLHILLYVEIALPVLLALWLELTAALFVLMAAGVIAHMLTSWWDTAFAQPRRHIAPIEQQVHSWQEMLPLFSLVTVAVLHAPALAEPRWVFAARGEPVSTPVRLGVTLALAAGAFPILEELWRGWRNSRLR